MADKVSPYTEGWPQSAWRCDCGLSDPCDCAEEHCRWSRGEELEVVPLSDAERMKEERDRLKAELETSERTRRISAIKHREDQLEQIRHWAEHHTWHTKRERSMVREVLSILNPEQSK